MSSLPPPNFQALAEVSEYEAGIYQIAPTDPVQGGDQGLSNYQGQGLANRTNWLKAQIAAEVSRAQAAEAQIDAALAAETTRAEAAETLLQTHINTEASTRATADTTLQTNINTEATTRNQVDTQLNAAIASEANTRNTVDVAINNALVAEENRAKSAEALLAPLNSPGFSGRPLTPTPAVNDNSAMIAHTNWVLSRLLDGGAGVLPFNGGYNGSIKLPGGAILQWGSAQSNGGVTTVVFPTPFPNVILNVVVCEGASGGWGNNYVTVHGVNSYNNAGVFINSYVVAGATQKSTAGLLFRWFAIGY